MVAVAAKEAKPKEKKKKKMATNINIHNPRTYEMHNLNGKKHMFTLFLDSTCGDVCVWECDRITCMQWVTVSVRYRPENRNESSANSLSSIQAVEGYSSSTDDDSSNQNMENVLWIGRKHFRVFPNSWNSTGSILFELWPLIKGGKING